MEGLLQSQPDVTDAFYRSNFRDAQGDEAAGVLIDWQGIDPSFAGSLAGISGRMRNALGANNLELWLSIPRGRGFADVRFGPAAGSGGLSGGPTARRERRDRTRHGRIPAQPWFEGWLRTLMGYGDPGQWILSLAPAGYNWNTSTGKTETIGALPMRMARAHESGASSVTESGTGLQPHPELHAGR